MALSGIYNTIRIAAQTAWGENRSGGSVGMQSVLNVIANRAAHPSWWGADIVSVCQKPFQFSCWNADATAGSDHQAMLAVPGSGDALFVEACRLAVEMVQGTLADITGGSDSYYAVSIPPPSFAVSGRFTVEIAGQRFYVTRSSVSA